MAELCLARIDTVVKTSAIHVRGWKQLQIVQSDWIDRQSGGSIACIENGLRRTTADAVDVVKLIDSRDGAGLGGTRNKPESLVIAKKESPVLDDWTAQTCAELILPQFCAGR